jgi:hypothetical protein
MLFRPTPPHVAAEPFSQGERQSPGLAHADCETPLPSFPAQLRGRQSPSAAHAVCKTPMLFRPAPPHVAAGPFSRRGRRSPGAGRAVYEEAVRIFHG